jgi:phosphoribosylglycinamide formyltransferase-1
MNLGVLASGRGSNLDALIAATDDGRLDSRIRVVLSDVANAPALARAGRRGIPAHAIDPGRPGARLSPEARRTFVSALLDHEVDLVCLAGFMRVVGRPFIDAFPDRILNIHPSLLPSFRGLRPQRQALDAGVKISGCTVHLVAAEIDAGPIVAQAAVEVFDRDTEETLSARILAEEHRLYPRAVRWFEEGRVTVADGRVRVAASSQGDPI